MAFFYLVRICIVCIANNINRNVYMYLNTRIFPTTGYARVLLFMFIRRKLGGTGTGCLFQFTYSSYCDPFHLMCAFSYVRTTHTCLSLHSSHTHSQTNIDDSLAYYLLDDCAYTYIVQCIKIALHVLIDLLCKVFNYTQSVGVKA